jgi:hypothetical protein
VYKHLDIPKDQILWCGIALGKEDGSARVNSLRSEREPVDGFAKFYGALPKL